MTLTACAMAAAIARGDSTSEDLTADALDRLARVVAPLNGLVRLTRETALERARAVDRDRRAGRPLGPLAGVPMAHKDLFFRAGRPADLGSRIRAGHVPTTTATVLARLDAAGAVDCGTLQMAEFALSPTGYNAHYGHAMNPWNPAHVAGGSSSGSGIAVAARAVPAALGTDTGGSIRHPASACGLTGLKPTHGAVSLAGTMPLSATLDTAGPLATDARDVARIMDVIAGEDAADPTTAWAPRLAHEDALTGRLEGLTLARPRGYYDAELDPAAAAALDDLSKALAAAGARVVDTRAPDMTAIHAFAHLVLAVEAATLHRPWLETRPEDYADQVRARIEPGLAYPATRYAEALMRRGPLARDWLAAALGDADAAILPAYPGPAPTIAETTAGDADQVAAAIARVTRNTRAINYLGLPALALPIGVAPNGLPLGAQLVGRPWTEPLLLRIADAFQRLTDWHRRPPARAVSA